MILDITSLNLNIRGVLHIGAFIGEEMSLYEQLNIKNIILFEPLSKHLMELHLRVSDRATIVPTALGNYNGEALINVSFTKENGRPWHQRGCGASSSVLEPSKHLEQYPHIVFTRQEKVKMTRLDDYVVDNNINIDDYNMINIDVQGYELEVFKGAVNTLNHIDYIISEVNRDEVYKDCAKVEEIDEFLIPYGFQRLKTDWAGDTWGDALYKKESI